VKPYRKDAAAKAENHRTPRVASVQARDTYNSSEQISGVERVARITTLFCPASDRANFSIFMTYFVEGAKYL
jgi:hypothetical protein